MYQQTVSNTLFTLTMVILLFVFLLLTIHSLYELNNQEAYFFRIIIFIGILVAACSTTIAAWWPILKDQYPSLAEYDSW